MINSFRAGWYLIYTKPLHEKKLYNQLTENDIRSFLPLRKVLRVWHDRKKLVDAPIFPSYVFIYLKGMQDYYAGMDAEGALYYVRTGKEIARISESLVNNIQLMTDQAKDLEVSEARFQSGRRMVINKGALTGLVCEIVECDRKHKLLVRVDLLQRNLLLTVPAECLTSV